MNYQTTILLGRIKQMYLILYYHEDIDAKAKEKAKKIYLKALENYTEEVFTETKKLELMEENLKELFQIYETGE